MSEGRCSLPASHEVLGRLAAALDEHWQELLRLRRIVLEQFDDDDIHDLRVASRRLRTVLDAVEPVLGKQAVRRLRRPVRGLTAELGMLRNLDEARTFLTGLHYAGLLPLTVSLERQRRSEVRRIREQLERAPCRQMSGVICRAGGQIASQRQEADRLVGWLSQHSQELYRPIHQLIQLQGLPELVAERHTLRIAIKKWRYFNELLAYLLGYPQGALTGRLKAYQSVLGSLNDLEVFREMVGSAAAVSAAVRRQVFAVITGRQQGLQAQLRELLTRQPLQYQFMA